MSKFALLFILIFFGGIAAALFHSGYAAFIVYQLVYFLNPDNRWWSSGIPGIRYSFVTVLVMMGVLAMRYREYSRVSPWGEQPVFKWMMLLLVMYYLAFAVALNPDMHKIFTTDLTKLFIIILIAYKLINTEAALKACIWAYLIGCTYIGYLATITGRNSDGRVEGIGMVDAPDANDTAAVLVPAAVLLMYLAWHGNNKIRLLTAFLGAFTANGLVLINSRGSFLGVVASLGLFLMFMIFSRRQEKGQRPMALFMIVVGLAGALYVTDDMFWERMGTLTNTEDKAASGSSRTEFWMATFDMLENHPFGMGGYGFNMLAPQYMDDQTRGGVEFRSVHSMWFQGLGEIGYHGMAVFFLMLFSLFKMSSKAKKFVVQNGQYQVYFQILAIECALLGYLAAGTFINRFRAEILYWMILFLAVAINVYYLQPKKAVEQEKASTRAQKFANRRLKSA